MSFSKLTSSSSSRRQACKLHLGSKAGCPNGVSCRFSHDEIFIRKHLSLCSVSGCRFTSPIKGGGGMCSSHQWAEKNKELTARFSVQPCKKAYGSPSGCEDPSCLRSHDRELIKQALDLGDCKNLTKVGLECQLLTTGLYCSTCTEQHHAFLAEKDALVKSKPCQFEFRSFDGCRHGDSCLFSHDRDTIKSGLDLHDCAEDGCEILCEPGFARCQPHYTQHKARLSATFAARTEKFQKREKRESSSSSSGQSSADDQKSVAVEISYCQGPNCMNAQHPVQVVGHRFCNSENGNSCFELLKEYQPSNATLLHFGRGRVYQE